ncbi:UNVERIFIED_CONTAM: hypothetical protein K2H54_011103 [Gekko kuhli]
MASLDFKDRPATFTGGSGQRQWAEAQCEERRHGKGAVGHRPGRAPRLPCKTLQLPFSPSQPRGGPRQPGCPWKTQKAPLESCTEARPAKMLCRCPADTKTGVGQQGLPRRGCASGLSASCNLPVGSARPCAARGASRVNEQPLTPTAYREHGPLPIKGLPSQPGGRRGIKSRADYWPPEPEASGFPKWLT